MGDLTVKAWKKHGRDRLYVNDAGGSPVAWLDQVTGHLELLRPESRAEVLKALARHVPRETCAEPPRPPLPPLTDADDLARNRPGASLKEKLDAEGPGPARRLLDAMLRRPSEWDSWRKGLEGERKVGRELRRFLGHGWQVLHSVPLPPRHDIDHLLIGPGGVFTLNTKNFRGRRIWVGDDVVKVDHGQGRPIPRKARRESERAAGTLSAHCGFPVTVTPLLVFVRPAALERATPHQKVRAYDDRGLAALAHDNGVLNAQQVAHIYAAARHRHTWRTA
ncbi:nuclease-related domain-containing protein [Streptomyces sp. NPDC001373]|uniref:nuclease-related domain-containing protein n=1 Tax=Streptomyces sp. NPDC001373 TaxID=3364565 RepID=UPI0036B369E7